MTATPWDTPQVRALGEERLRLLANRIPCYVCISHEQLHSSISILQTRQKTCIH